MEESRLVADSPPPANVPLVAARVRNTFISARSLCASAASCGSTSARSSLARTHVPAARRSLIMSQPPASPRWGSFERERSKKFHQAAKLRSREDSVNEQLERAEETAHLSEKAMERKRLSDRALVETRVEASLAVLQRQVIEERDAADRRRAESNEFAARAQGLRFELQQLRGTSKWSDS